MSLMFSNISICALTYPFTAADSKLRAHTWFSQRYQIRHVLHEDATLELKFRFPSLVNQCLGGNLVLGLAKIDVLAAQKDRLEQIDMVLEEDKQMFDMHQRKHTIIPVSRHLCRWPSSRS